MLTVVGVTPLASIRALSAAPVGMSIITAGMAVSSSAPIRMGGPAALFATTTAVAPAAAAFATFVGKVHTPRWMSAILLAKKPDEKAEQPVKFAAS